jgi:hypothetical protein
VAGQELNDQASDSATGILLNVFRPTLRPTQPPDQCVSADFTLWNKMARACSYHSSPSNAVVGKFVILTILCTSIYFHGMVMRHGKFYLYFALKRG